VKRSVGHHKVDLFRPPLLSHFPGWTADSITLNFSYDSTAIVNRLVEAHNFVQNSSPARTTIDFSCSPTIAPITTRPQDLLAMIAGGPNLHFVGNVSSRVQLHTASVAGAVK